jgi:hypothetical protein
MTITLPRISQRPGGGASAADKVERLAIRSLSGAVGPLRIIWTLVRLRSGLPLRDRRDWWMELCDALTEYQDAEDGNVDWSHVPPDLRHSELWADHCRTRVQEAAHALAGGAR